MMNEFKHLLSFCLGVGYVMLIWWLTWLNSICPITESSRGCGQEFPVLLLAVSSIIFLLIIVGFFVDNWSKQ
jgi:hypothetical protein